MLLSHKTFELLSKGKFSSTVLEKGLFSLSEGWGTGGEKENFSVKKIYVLVLRHFPNVIGQVQLPQRLLLETLQAEN